MAQLKALIYHLLLHTAVLTIHIRMYMHKNLQLRTLIVHKTHYSQ